MPLFFVDLNTALTIANLAARADSDDQMRLRLSRLSDQSLSELRGISAFGKRLCLKKFRTHDSPSYLSKMTPQSIAGTRIYYIDNSHNRFMTAVEHVRALTIAQGVWLLTVYSHD